MLTDAEWVAVPGGTITRQSVLARHKRGLSVPNTLVHIAVQAGPALIASRGRGDLRWVLTGCVVPDVPWIVRRLAMALLPGLDPLAITAYAFVQSSLLWCLLLSGCLACFAVRPRRAFLVMAVGSLVHLVLDATQIKPGNGVHLLAPLTWDLVGFELLWPEAGIFWLLTAVGAGVGAWALVFARPVHALRFDRPVLWAVALICAGAYLLAPLALLDGPRRGNNLSIAILAAPERHLGEVIALDRARVSERNGMLVVRAHNGREFIADGLESGALARVSLWGRLVAADRIEVIEAHRHHGWFRDVASYVGLLIIAIVWVRALAGEVRDRAVRSRTSSPHR